ncbi:MAG: TRAP transporter substrate-binding protein [Xanthobacteraceae bacterium]
MKTMLKTTLAASLICAMTGLQPALAQEVQLKASLFPPPSNPLVKAMNKWADDLRDKSNGRLIIKVFPASQMGPPPRQFDLARTGVADISVHLHGSTPGRFPLTEMTHVPGITKGVYGASLALSEIAPQAFAADYPGVRVLNVLTLPTVIISRSEIASAADLKGKRVRAAGSVQSDVLDALGAVPTLVQPGDMNDALSKGMIEGVSTAYSGIDSYKLDEIGKFVAEGDMGSVTFATVMNLAAYNALPPDLKKLIDEDNGMANARVFARMLADDELRLHDNLVTKGIKFTKLADDGALKQAGNKILEQAIKKASAQGADARKILEQIKAAVAKHEGEN